MAIDPRFVRSADALREAVLELAAEQPIERVAVTEIARRAGVTRATFYNHATSPQALLAAALGDELDEMRARFLADVEADRRHIAESWRSSTTDVARHILRHEAVYRAGLAPSADRDGTALAELLAQHIEDTLAAYRETLGTAPADPEESARLAMRASFQSHGVVGAFRAWLAAPRMLPLDDAVTVIMDAVSPRWFDSEEAPA
ncbi:TetR/AcrR family transcriptional regulator [Demequina pelophila]|uniref:TetR/AcrR family transcriptional regulator n=1 Tax=Demequina pelophila TaxID=1638984 RepID=UPI0007856A11|nr:TetR/AcrR family transcriptional regulator [Demequina pelophila]